MCMSSRTIIWGLICIPSGYIAFSKAERFCMYSNRSFSLFAFLYKLHKIFFKLLLKYNDSRYSTVISSIYMYGNIIKNITDTISELFTSELLPKPIYL